ncbi:YggT family protein [Candidatus Poribacteria bacterium]|nr:YggT family protein [Candidatus Poribacteria bacterium]
MELLISFIITLIQIYVYIIVANVFLSWVVFISHNINIRKIYWMTNRFVEPVVAPFRRMLYPWTRQIGLDFSPFLLIIVLEIAIWFLRRMLYY